MLVRLMDEVSGKNTEKTLTLEDRRVSGRKAGFRGGEVTHSQYNPTRDSPGKKNNKPPITVNTVKSDRNPSRGG